MSLFLKMTGLDDGNHRADQVIVGGHKRREVRNYHQRSGLVDGLG